jgi:dephospho-CoA kinase
VIAPDGSADRAAIGRIVFADPVELLWLEQLLHPRVIRAQTAWRDELTARPDPPAVIVTEVPLLYETGGDERFDVVVVITAPPEVRAARRPLGDGREDRLLPEEEKVRRADYAYVNDGTLEELDAFVADVVRDITR